MKLNKEIFTISTWISCIIVGGIVGKFVKTIYIGLGLMGIWIIVIIFATMIFDKWYYKQEYYELFKK